MSDDPHLRRLALSLLDRRRADPGLEQLSQAEWERLDRMLAEHRLQPLLHAEWSGVGSGGTIPDFIACRWEAAHRAAALTALQQRGALIRASRLLSAADIPAFALKGSWLAWHVYPLPAMRPMRDLDLLVHPVNLRSAWLILRENGHGAPLGEPDWTAPLREKHLPALLSPDGTVIELHSRVWEHGIAARHTMPEQADAQLIARARAGSQSDPVLYPIPADMLQHLVVHGVYSHWLDAGPLVLADIEFLLRSFEPDWPDFWQNAALQGWDRGAALLFALIDRWRQPSLSQRSNCPIAVPDRLLEALPDLLLQPMEGRPQARVLARLQRDGAYAVLREKCEEARAEPAYFARHLLRRIAHLLSGLGNHHARQKGQSMKQLGDWLLSD